MVFTQVDWSKADEPGFGNRAAATLRQAVARGARGLKVLKALGLYHRDRKGKLLAVDDPRFDPIWAECGRLQIPVAIHTGDPEAFFHPADRHNERLEELWMNPDWSFHGKDNPDLPSLLAARDRVIDRHPRTTLRRPARGRLAREPGLRVGAAAAATPTPTSSSGPARRSSAGSRGARASCSWSSPTASCSGPTSARRPSCMPATSAGWRPPTNTSRISSTRSRDAGASTAWSCPPEVLEKIYSGNARRILERAGARSPAQP